uniref:Uncharacterized protein n=1 Tax=Meloidogyne enterolobii TaxID=390850 RepID=A0A6V7UZ43_MELEN|nr:unnamed protein product [Meloidogyne enterolobii]
MKFRAITETWLIKREKRFAISLQFKSSSRSQCSRSRSHSKQMAYTQTGSD